MTVSGSAFRFTIPGLAALAAAFVVPAAVSAACCRAHDPAGGFER